MTVKDIKNNTSCNVLVRLASEILQTPVNPDLSLVAQGLDSFGAKNLVDTLSQCGYAINYDCLLNEASVRKLSDLILSLALIILILG
jgi:aryl carrier-like protein